MTKVIGIIWSIVVVLIIPSIVLADLTDGLLAYYPFNGNAIDETSNGHNGVVHGATLTIDRFGNPNSAYIFDGIDDYIEVSRSSDFGFVNQSFSVSVWGKIIENRPVYESFVGLGSTGKQYCVNKWSGGDGFYTEFDCGPSQVSFYPDGGLQPDTWYHLVSVVNIESGNMEFYGNGILSGTNSLIDFDFSSDTLLRFGMRPGIGNYLLGVVDDVRIYGRALSSIEITELYNLPDVGTLTLLTPNGGETLIADTLYTITWESSGDISQVLIEYSSDSGVTWQIISTTQDTGSHKWHIDGPPSNQYLVRITNADSPPCSDTSDGTFTVYECLEDIVGDLNGDCIVNMIDLAMMTQNWVEKGYARIYFNPLDTNPNWTTEGEWAFGQPTGGGGTEFGNPDPCMGHTGTNVYGVNLNGDYTVAIGGPYCLTAGPFDCSTLHDMKLRFARWLNTDEPGYVASRIEVSNDGANWHTLWENTAAITDSNWQLVEYDIGVITNHEATVFFRWSYEILDDRAYPYSSWNIDDIELLCKF